MTVIVLGAEYTDLLNITRRASCASQTVGTPPTPDDELVVHAYSQGAALGLARVLHVERARREHRQGLLCSGRIGGSSDFWGLCEISMTNGGGRLRGEEDLPVWVLGAVYEEGCEVFWVGWLSGRRAWIFESGSSVEPVGCHRLRNRVGQLRRALCALVSRTDLSLDGDLAGSKTLRRKRWSTMMDHSSGLSAETKRSERENLTSLHDVFIPRRLLASDHVSDGKRHVTASRSRRYSIFPCKHSRADRPHD